MCLIAFAWNAHPRHALVVAANRDEFYERPTAPAAWWSDAPVFAGRDLRGGGTWMGVTRGGRFAALTNLRDPAKQKSDAPSRGRLVSDVLTDPRPLHDALWSAMRDCDRYNGFTLLAAQWSARAGEREMYVASSTTGRIEVVEAGVHALSNAALDTPWPKVVRMRDALGDALDATLAEADDDRLITALGEALADREIADDAALPSTGVSREWERALSSRFIALPTYGTRASTVLLMKDDGRVTFVERDAAAGREPAIARFTLE